jgi:hypothetical protein
MRKAPPSAEILGRLDPVTLVLRSSLKKAIDRTRRFLEPREEWDPSYAPCRVRLEARQLIKAAAASREIDVREDDEERAASEFEVWRVPNIGLQFFRDGIIAKVLKRSSDPDMPIPVSGSRKRIGFCNQQRDWIPHPTNKDAPHRWSEWNVFYLWDWNAKHHFSRLSVILPSAGGTSKVDMAYYWIADVPLLSTARGATSVEYGTGHTQPPLIEDVPGYGLPEDDTETGTNEPQ